MKETDKRTFLSRRKSRLRWMEEQLIQGENNKESLKFSCLYYSNRIRGALEKPDKTRKNQQKPVFFGFCWFSFVFLKTAKRYKQAYE